MKAILTNGARSRTVYHDAKGINIWDPDDTPEAWTGTPQNDPIQLVPAIQSALQARCKAISDMPFTIFGKGDKEIDNSEAYTNAVGFLPNPRNFLWMTEAALVIYGRSYWLKKPNKFQVIKGMQYFKPDSIKDVIDSTGLVRFDRNNGKSTEKYAPDKLLYIWLPDAAVEIGPPTVWPLEAARLSAKALERINTFIKDYMERGAVKAMLLAAKNMPNQEEAERVENWFNKFMRGVSNLRWKIFNADAITPTVVGEGLEAFKGIEIVTDLTQQVHTALGTRHMLEDENYATAEVRQREFYTNTIVPESKIIADALNDQMLTAMGYHIEFDKERLDIFAADESLNATALGALTSALSGPSPDIIELGLSILNYDLTEDQQVMLDNIQSTKEKNKAEMAAALQGKQDNQNKPDNQPADTTPVVDTSMRTLELSKWLRKSLKHLGKDVEFECENIPDEICNLIHAGLPECKTAEDVKALFEKAKTEDITPAPVYEAPNFATILDAMRIEVEGLKAVRQPIVVNVPAGEAPQVTVNVPKADPVKVDVSLPEIKIPKPAKSDTVVTGPRKRHEKQKITRGQNGQMTGTETDITYEY